MPNKKTLHDHQKHCIQKALDVAKLIQCFLVPSYLEALNVPKSVGSSCFATQCVQREILVRVVPRCPAILAQEVPNICRVVTALTHEEEMGQSSFVTAHLRTQRMGFISHVWHAMKGIVISGFYSGAILNT